MEKKQIQETNQSSQTQAKIKIKVNNLQISHQHLSIELFKKMFSKTKTKSKNHLVTNQQSLLFSRKNASAMLNAFRSKRKYLIGEQIKHKILELGKQISNYSTVDSPRKPSFYLESVRYDFEKGSKGKELYKKILQKTQRFTNDLPELHFESKKTKKNWSMNKSKNSQQSNFTLPAINPQYSDEFCLDLMTSKSIQSRETEESEIFRLRSCKNRDKSIQIKRYLLPINSATYQSQENPQSQSQTDVQQKTVNHGTSSEIKLSKEDQSVSRSFQLNKMKPIKSLTIKKQKFHKGYMYFHQQARNFIKQHRQKLNSQARIKESLVTGISASNYAVIDLQTMTPVIYKNFNKQIQIASISKVMVCYLCLLACKKYQVDIKKQPVRISLQASQMIGTSAGLQIGDYLTLEQALYALMLPSGNDASVAIAQTIGKIIQRHKNKQTKKTYYQTFIAHMNMLSRQLKLDQQWKNSSGLPLNPNHSTTKDICLLTIAAMMDSKFKEIVSCKEFDIKIKNERTGLKKVFKWKNTNKLLNDGWEGVKTGTTESAGHCLIAKKGQYLIAVFDSKTLAKRFVECSELYQLVKSKQSNLFPKTQN